MKEYFILLEGKEQGPFTIIELANKGVMGETMVWYVGSQGWQPASQVNELLPLLSQAQLSQSTRRESLHATVSSGSPVKSKKSGIASIITGLILLVILTVGVVFWFQKRGKDTVQKKEWVRTIHEREVQKTLQEQKTERIVRKQQAEKRRGELAKCRANLRSLQSQLNVTLEEKSEALEELDDINRPHLFRSRAMKEAQLADQKAYLASLDRKEGTLRSKIAKCRQEIAQFSDTLSSPLPRR